MISKLLCNIFLSISKVDLGNGGEIFTDVELILCRDWPDNRGSTVFYTFPVRNSSHLSRGNPKIHWGNSETVDCAGAYNVKREESRKNRGNGALAQAHQLGRTRSLDLNILIFSSYIVWVRKRDLSGLRDNYTIGWRAIYHICGSLRVNEHSRTKFALCLRRAIISNTLAVKMFLSH